IMINLIGNAIKFTPKGEIRFGCDLISHTKGKAHLRWWVADTGIGISHNAIEKIFLPFTQADQTITKQFGGTGVGLALSRKFLNLMGSEFEVSSNPGKGSRFSFEIHLEVCEQQNNGEEFNWLNNRKEPYEGQTILAVDDNSLNLMIVEGILKELGVKVLTATSGKEAIALVDTLEPRQLQGCLMDVQMPELSGLDTCKLIHQKEAWAALPIFALTAGVTVEEKQKATEAGMAGLISKPIDVDELKKALRRISALPVQPVD
ncbi:MAG: response regulator, partial [Limnobacter sp.]|nr:response regulator [Limnobacter sp.]